MHKVLQSQQNKLHRDYAKKPDAAYKRISDQLQMTLALVYKGTTNNLMKKNYVLI